MQYLFNPFYGKLSRGGWWSFQFVIFSVVFTGSILTAMFLADPHTPANDRNASEITVLILILMAALYANFSTCLNRLRDTGRNGLWYLSFLIPYAGLCLMVYFCGIEQSYDSDEAGMKRRPRYFAGNGSRTRNQVFGSS